MIRDDISNKLIHLVRGDTIEAAFTKFLQIIDQGKLLGGTGYIKGGFNCICFTETPLAKLGYVLANPDVAVMRYRPFGIMLDKNYVFDSGGLPVIYQPDEEYSKLHDDHKFRHVRFEPSNPENPIDLAWEREWRLRADELELPRNSTTVVVPKRKWRDALVESHDETLTRLIAEHGEEAGRDAGSYPWHIIVLEDLGIPIPDGI